MSSAQIAKSDLVIVAAAVRNLVPGQLSPAANFWVSSCKILSLDVVVNRQSLNFKVCRVVIVEALSNQLIYNWSKSSFAKKQK